MQSSVPPSITILPGVAEAGVVPRPVAAEIEIVPAFIVEVPSYVFTPESVQVPAPTLVMESAPVS